MFRRDISENHEKAAQHSFCRLSSLWRSCGGGAPGGTRPAAGTTSRCGQRGRNALFPCGPGETWRLTVRVETADEETAAPDKAAARNWRTTRTSLDMKGSGGRARLPGHAYAGISGDDASSIESVALDFAPHTDYRLEVRRSRADASDFDALITGAQPIMTVYYPENVELAGRIPPWTGTIPPRSGQAAQAPTRLIYKRRRPYEQKRENVRFLPPVKRYVNAVEHRLHLPLREKARVMSDISTSIAARHEAGESYEAIMADMGTPEAVAQPFNQAFAGQYKGQCVALFVAGAGLAVLAATAAVLVFTAGMARGMEMAFLPQAFPLGRRLFRRHHWRGRRPHRSVVTSYAGIFSMGPLDALVIAGALLSLLFMPGSGHPRHQSIFALRSALAGICAAVFCVRFFLAVAMLSLAEGSPASLAGMFLSPGFLLTATALGLVIWRTPQKPENKTEEENHE